MPLAPRLATMAEPVAGRGVPLDVAHGHGRRADERRPVGQGRHQRPGHAGLGRAVAGQHLADGLLRQLLRPPPPGRPGRPRPGREAARQLAHTAGSGRPRRGGPRCPRDRPTPPRRSPGPVRRRRPPATGPAPSRPAGARAGARPSACAPRRSRRGGAGRRTRPPSTGAGSRQPDRGSASTGQPAAAASACTASGSPAPAPATITPRCWSRPAASASSWSRSSAGRPLTAWYHGRPSGRPGGRSPASPTSGSRKGRLRWTGPGHGPAASASARDTSDRQRDAIAASGGPGSADAAHRRAVEAESGRWSGARPPPAAPAGGRPCRRPAAPRPGGPRPRPRGARPRRCRSCTPRPPADRSPGRARGRRTPAERSSWNTCRRSSGRSARASASGVEREPGQTTTSATPARTTSSARVAQNVAATAPGARRGGRAHRPIVYHDAGRDLVRRRVPVVLHRQAALRGGPRPLPRARRRDGRVPRLPARPDRSPGVATSVREVYDRKFGGPTRPSSSSTASRRWRPRRGSTSTSTGRSGPTPSSPTGAVAGRAAGRPGGR